MSHETAHALALRLRRMYDENLSRHVITDRVITDKKRASFTLQRPGTGTYSTEIVVLRWGTLLVHGDISTTVFSGCSGYGTWRAVLEWMRSADYSYAEEKASIGSGCSEMASSFDPEIATGDVLRWRRGKQISADVAREALQAIRDGDYRRAQDLIHQEDFELGLGQCTAPRVLMAQAAITKLCELLDAEETERVAMLSSTP